MTIIKTTIDGKEIELEILVQRTPGMPDRVTHFITGTGEIRDCVGSSESHYAQIYLRPVPVCHTFGGVMFEVVEAGDYASSNQWWMDCNQAVHYGYPASGYPITILRPVDLEE